MWEVWNSSVFDLLHRFDKPRLGGVGSRRDCYCCSMPQEPLSILSFCTIYPEQGLTWTRSYFLLIYLCQFYRWNSKSFCKFVTESSFLFLVCRPTVFFYLVARSFADFSNLAAFLPTFYHPLFGDGTSKAVR